VTTPSLFVPVKIFPAKNFLYFQVAHQILFGGACGKNSGPQAGGTPGKLKVPPNPLSQKSGGEKITPVGVSLSKCVTVGRFICVVRQLGRRGWFVTCEQVGGIMAAVICGGASEADRSAFLAHVSGCDFSALFFGRRCGCWGNFRLRNSTC